jgi:hypothetical protein
VARGAATKKRDGALRDIQFTPVLLEEEVREMGESVQGDLAQAT